MNSRIDGEKEILTTAQGVPVADNQNSLTAGLRGPVLLQDVQLIEKLAHFDRERIPERVVHARGTGAHGYFQVHQSMAEYTKAHFLQNPGEKTPVLVRFSLVVGSRGSAETVRDPRGFAVKFYTKEGNYDLVGNNLPVFFIRDAIKFPDMVHSLKPSPTTNIQDPNRFFDFFSHVPESTHMLTRLYSDLGTPVGYRFMDGSSVHAYKFVNAAGEYRYVKFRWASKQGVKTLDAKQVAEVQSRDFNHLTRDLVDAIARKDYPQWDLFIQVIEPGQLAGFDFDPLDATKIWPDVPETKIGTMTLNRNPSNVFQETEQSAFAPANLVPGIEPSEDRLLQGRIFSYADTQLYRVGTNGLQLPINRPVAAVLNGNQDGAANIGATTTDVNYQPSRRFPMTETADAKYSQLPLSGSSQQQRIPRTLNFRQAGEFYRTLDATAKKNLVANLAGDLGQVTHADTRLTMLSHFYKADADYGTRLTQALKGDLAQVRRAAESLAE